MQTNLRQRLIFPYNQLPKREYGYNFNTQTAEHLLCLFLIILSTCVGVEVMCEGAWLKEWEVPLDCRAAAAYVNFVFWGETKVQVKRHSELEKKHYDKTLNLR